MTLLQPWFLLGFPLIWWLIWRNNRRGQTLWFDLIKNPELRAHVLEGEPGHSGKWSFGLGLHLLLIAALQPMLLNVQESGVRSGATRVVLFDLSPSMGATDLSPTRATRAQFKLRDILTRMDGDRIGLIAFAAAPYVLVPPTDDAQTIDLMIDGLAPELMPVAGNDLGAALERGIQMLVDEGGQSAELIVLSDATEASLPEDTQRMWQAVERAKEAGFAINVLGFGSDRPIQLGVEGGVLSQVFDPTLLTEIAKRSGGIYVDAGVDEADLDQIWQRTLGIDGAADDIDGFNLGPWILLFATLAIIGGWRQWGH